MTSSGGATSPDDGGLNLFDDTASAAGNFPSALRGYDRTAVDDYVRTLESRAVEANRRVRALERQVSDLEERVESSTKDAPASQADYSTLGARASDILRLAEEQARDMTDRATREAEQIKEVARREGDALRSAGEREAADIKMTGLKEIAELRARGEADAKHQIEQTRAEAEAITTAAARQAEAARRQADQGTSAVTEKAQIEAERLRTQTERELAGLREAAAKDRDALLADLQTRHADAVVKSNALLAEATRYHEESARRLAADVEEAARVRAAALAEAEQVKLRAARETEQQIATATKQAKAINERTQQEFSWRQEQLRKETELLAQRKQAVLSQLSGLSELARQNAVDFPELSPPTAAVASATPPGADQGQAGQLLAAATRPAQPAAAATRPAGQPPNGAAEERAVGGAKPGPERSAPTTGQRGSSTAGS